MSVCVHEGGGGSSENAPEKCFLSHAYFNAKSLCHWERVVTTRIFVSTDWYFGT